MINFLYRNHFWNVVPQISINILTKGNMQEIVTYRFNNKSLTNTLMKSWSWKKYIIKMEMNSKAVFYTIKLQALCNHSYINMHRQIRLIFYTLNNENYQIIHVELNIQLPELFQSFPQLSPLLSWYHLL